MQEAPLLTLDSAAERKLSEMREAGRFDASALRVSVSERGAAFRYALERVEAESRRAGDAGVGSRSENPTRPRLLDLPLAARVQGILDEQINPGIAAHGGRVTLVDVQ